MKTDPYNIPTATSTDAEWMDWYSSLDGNFGHKEANHLFTLAWTKAGSSVANTTTLRTFAKKNGLVIDENVFENITDLGSSIGDYIGDFFMLGKYMAYGVGIILVAGLGVFVFHLAKHPAQSMQILNPLNTTRRIV